jgi:hypothetical protein
LCAQQKPGFTGPNFFQTPFYFSAASGCIAIHADDRFIREQSGQGFFDTFRTLTDELQRFVALRTFFGDLLFRTTVVTDDAAATLMDHHARITATTFGHLAAAGTHQHRREAAPVQVKQDLAVRSQMAADGRNQRLA